MEGLLREIEEKPFNNFRPYLLKKGAHCPDELGGNCIWQCQQLERSLQALGLDPWHVRAKDSRHHITFCREPDGSGSEDVVIYNPSRFMQRPLYLRELEYRDRVIIPAYPVVCGRMSEVVCSKEKERGEVLAMRTHVPSFERGKETEGIFVYNLNISTELPSETHFVDKGLISTGRLVLAVLRGEDVHRIVYSPGHGGALPLVTAGRLGIDNKEGFLQEGTEAWKRFVKIAEMIEVEPAHLAWYFEVAAEIRDELVEGGYGIS